MYLGRAKRAVVPLAAFVVLLAGCGVFGVISTPIGFVTVVASSLAVYLFCLVDSMRVGFRVGRAGPHWYTRWYALVGWVVLVFLFVQLWISIREPVLGYAVFHVPGDSMEPTLHPGDVVLVDTRAGEPELNSLVIVRHPFSDETYVRRLKERAGAGTYVVVKEFQFLPDDPAWNSLPAANIEGVVTAIIWPSDRRKALD